MSRTNDNAMAWVAGLDGGVISPQPGSKLADSCLPFATSKKQMTGEYISAAEQSSMDGPGQSKNKVGMKAMISMMRRQLGSHQA